MYCASFLTTVTLGSCGSGGGIEVVSGITFDTARDMDEATQAGILKDEEQREENTRAQGSKATAPKIKPFTPPTKGVQAEMGIIGSDWIYIISESKLAELEAQGLGRPEDKQERIEWFKEHHTKKIQNPKQRLPMRHEVQD
ncbi:hypothetical protein NLU13_7821 [Sarocladium strictum]|uniref:Uncharacterized protein n=1 Tax=Sarocladium strictum TaxID=5046 RepID=A0AA39GDH7_SARSR|nr:hypothetical protein NLU13_7821 [Sarocladium strictum]